MDQERVIELFQKTGALQQGHFLLTSGLHSSEYFQCAKVLQYPSYNELLCREIAAHFSDKKIDVVVSPAVGGIMVGQEVARQVGSRVIFAERENGKMSLRRGFEIKSDEVVLICEDVITTGGSVLEVVELARNAGATILGVACIVDRSTTAINFGVDFFHILRMPVPVYQPENCPLCKSGIPLVKPGSRGLNVLKTN